MQDEISAVVLAAGLLADAVEAGDFESRQQQVAEMERVRGLAQAAMDAARDELGDDAWLTIRTLRAVAARVLDLPIVAAEVPALISRVTTAEASVWELARSWYGDGRRAEEITQLNRLPWPLRVPAGTELLCYAD